MDAFILIHEETAIPNGGEIQSSTWVGGYDSLAKAKESFDFYLDSLETEWRESYAEIWEKISKDYTFNRFSEPSGDYVLSANAGCNFVAVRKVEIE